MKKRTNERKEFPLLPLKSFANFLTAGLLLLGSASCGSESESKEAYEEGLGYEEVDTAREKVYVEVEDDFLAWDTDGNLRIDRSEFEAAANNAGLFSEWNKNGDNVLTASELSQGVFTIYDEDRDDLLDKEEFAAWNTAWGGAYEDRWDAWDTDDNNMLTVEEFSTGFDEAGVFYKWDVVDDQVYTKEEVYNGLFEALDTGGDGYLTEEEYRQIGDFIRAN